ncbi:beta-N-acetylhexosaminidase [Pseudaquidulcibacter saccharophilus]|uniref:beta-N-acetylhexosaminidase n=1 Tax=Pseudaquidulcibacter saccharophilus TaxID=2831900 RepID=UPI001EFF2D4E|nr:family 20 glycosylhydrolase [Pseudaquidulcibacter saccharophilus]
MVRRLLITTAIISPLAIIPTMSLAQDINIGVEWQAQKYVTENNHHYTEAAFIITNKGKLPINTNDWKLCFSSIIGAKTLANSDIIIEPVAGPLYCARFVNSSMQIPVGASQTMRFEHTETVTKIEKAPVAPYIVFDNAPNNGIKIHDYKTAPIVRTKQIEGAAIGTSTIFTPQDIYIKNQNIIDIPKSELPAIFPSPKESETYDGELRLNGAPTIIASPKLKTEAAFASKILKSSFNKDEKTQFIKLEIAKLANQNSPDAYELDIDPKSGIKIIGNSPSGVYYGLQSLRQLLPNSQTAQYTLPALKIIDAPDFEYRGLLVDVARNFQPKEQILRTIDIMARLKLNKLHLHLVDDEGWRLEIKQIPELTQIGAKRGEGLWYKNLPSAYGSGPDINDPHGSGFYTQKDFIEILQYGAKNHVEIIPEIEMPGHSRAAVKSMEARAFLLKQKKSKDASKFLLSDPDDKSQYHTAQNYTDDVMNPGLDSTYVFIDTVISEIAGLYKKAGVKQNILHIGADELAGGAWEKSPIAINKMKELKLNSTNELWDYFYDKVTKSLIKNGFKIGAWEELGVKRENTYPINPKFLERKPTLYVWNNLEGSEDLAYRLANAGYKIVLGPVSNFYFDMAYNEDVLEPGHNWGGYIDLEKAYAFNPYALQGTDKENKVKLNDNAKANIVGIEAMMFSETMRDPARIDYMMAPRIFALSQNAWARHDNSDAKKWSVFANQLGKNILPQIDAQLPDFYYRIAPPGLMAENNIVSVNYQLPGFELRYTTDGTEPTINSQIVKGPITDRAIINVCAFNKIGRKSRTSTIDNR